MLVSAHNETFFDEVHETFATAINSDLNKSERTHADLFSFVELDIGPEIEAISAWN